MGTVAPRLVMMGRNDDVGDGQNATAGPLLLLGGREMTLDSRTGLPAHNHDIVLWVNRDGWGERWEEKYSLVDAHNRQVSRNMKFVTHTSYKTSSSYGSILKTSATTATLTYDQQNPGQPRRAWSMRIEII